MAEIQKVKVRSYRLTIVALIAALLLLAAILARTIYISAGGNGFFAHAFCLQNYAPLVYWMVGANLMTWLSYILIPLFIFRIREREDLPRWVLLLSIAFILACGHGHLVTAITYFVPIYWIQAIVDTATALVSLATAVALYAGRSWFKTSRSRAEMEALLSQFITDGAQIVETARDPQAALLALDARVRAYTAEAGRLLHMEMPGAERGDH